MSDTPDQNDRSDGPAGANQRPRDASTLIIVDEDGIEPKVLMGKRRTDQVFMPGTFVFPGGRVDKTDKLVESLDELADEEIEKLLHDMKGHASQARARALALAAVREVYEETGIIIGQRQPEATPVEIEGWQEFFSFGFLPQLSRLCFFARAITPPGRPRRYDTRFFCIPAAHVGLDTGRRDEELSEIGWYTLDECAQLDLPPITRVVLEDLKDQLTAGPLGPSRKAVPYYYQRHGTFYRELIDISRP